MAAVRARLPADVRVRLVVVGDGRSAEKVARRVHARRLDDVVVLAGRLTHEQIRDLYRRADAFVAPARLESFGIAALEARCAGVPVVARRDTGVGTFVRHGHEGLLVGSDDELADGLVALCRDPGLRAELAGSPPPAEFDWPAVLDATDALYVRAGARPRVPEAPA
jgi:glycosyltransferase involved in cell wall biosynthesis